MVLSLRASPLHDGMAYVECLKIYLNWFRILKMGDFTLKEKKNPDSWCGKVFSVALCWPHFSLYVSDLPPPPRASEFEISSRPGLRDAGSQGTASLADSSRRGPEAWEGFLSCLLR